MNTLSKALALFLSVVLLNGCASIVSKSTYPLRITTDPSGAQVVVKDADGIEIFNGKSPTTVKLAAGAGFFKKASYSVTVRSEGYEEQTVPVNFNLDGWYFGNILLGGLIGMLIVDPATGAMYQIESEYMSVRLNKAISGLYSPQLIIMDLASVPNKWKGGLERISVDQDH